VTSVPLAGSLAVSLSDNLVNNALFIGIGAVVFIVFAIASRPIAAVVAARLHQANVRADMIVVGRRVVTLIVLVLGLFAAVAFALQQANVALFGLVLATIVAALGVQDLLKDYVSGYYILFERHIRVGDRISLEGAGSGTVTDVKLRVTLLKTESGDLLVVPNSELFNKAVTVHVRAVERAAETARPKPAPPK
jgi:small-conductance mechanosensitive channel